MNNVGTPSVSGMKSALEGAGVGLVGGALVGLSTKLFGSGILGSVAGIVLAGSVLKGESSKIVTTVLGEPLGEGLFTSGGPLSGLLSSASSTVSSVFQAV